jgi:hypothetical protein
MLFLTVKIELSKTLESGSYELLTMVEIAKHGGTSQQRESASIHYSAAMSVVQLSRYWAPQNIAPICIASQTAEEVFSVMGVLGISSNPLYLDSSDSEGAIDGLMPALFSKWKHAERVGVAPYMGINPDILQFRSYSLFWLEFSFIMLRRCISKAHLSVCSTFSRMQESSDCCKSVEHGRLGSVFFTLFKLD